MENEEIIFGQRDNAVALRLDRELKRASISRNSPGRNREPAYRATSLEWRLAGDGRRGI